MIHASAAARRTAGALFVTVALALPLHSTQGQLRTTTNVTCVGGSIGCSQMDFFIQFIDLTGPTTLDAFTLSLSGALFRFAAPGVTEAEDALGFNFYNPTVSSDGLTLAGSFDFGAFLDPDIASTLRLRAEMAEVPPGSSDASAMAFAYSVTAGGETVAEGQVTPPPTTVTPEPATLGLLGTGLFGLAGWARHRRKSCDVAP